MKSVLTKVAPEHDSEQISMFVLLKQALKVNGKTYSQLAEYLGVSELSVKRLFRDKDCKLSRVFEVCEFLGITLEDLLAMHHRKSEAPEYLSESMEQALAGDLTLFTVFVLLISEIGIDDIKNVTGHNDAELYIHMRQLEKIGLIRLGPNNHFRFTVPIPIRWRFNGVLAAELKRLNLCFLGHYFDHIHAPHHQLITKSRLLSASSLADLQADAADLIKKFDYLASQDRLFYPTEQLKLVKLVLAQGPFPILDLV